MIIGKKTLNTVRGYWKISNNVPLVKPYSKPTNAGIMQTYRPTTDSSEEEVEEFYNHLDSIMKQCKRTELNLIMGNFK